MKSSNNVLFVRYVEESNYKEVRNIISSSTENIQKELLTFAYNDEEKTLLYLAAKNRHVCLVDIFLEFQRKLNLSAKSIVVSSIQASLDYLLSTNNDTTDIIELKLLLGSELIRAYEKRLKQIQPALDQASIINYIIRNKQLQAIKDLPVDFVNEKYQNIVLQLKVLKNNNIITVLKPFYDIFALDKEPLLMFTYEGWFKRFERVLFLYVENQGTISDHIMEELQLFLLDMGHFNACFTIEELDKLKYPKSPFVINDKNTYLRSDNTWAMEMLSEKYRGQHSNLEKIYPIFVGSFLFFQELERYYQFIDYTEVQKINLGSLKEDLKQNNKLTREYLIKIDRPTDYKFANIGKLFKDKTKEFIEKIGISIPSKSKSKIILFYIDKFENCDVLVVENDKKQGSLRNFIGNLGYRIDPIYTIRVLLRLEEYKKLFFETESTLRFLSGFKKVASSFSRAALDILFGRIIKKLDTKAYDYINSEETLLTINDYINADRAINLFSKHLSTVFHNIQEIRSLNDNLLNNVLFKIVIPEINEELEKYIRAADLDNLSNVIRSTQSITEVMQLCVNLKDKLDCSNVIKSLLFNSNELMYEQEHIQIAITSYAMRAFVRVLQILEPDDPRHTTSIAVTSQTYFELLFSLEKLHTQAYSVYQIRHTEDIKKDSDIIFIEMHSNNVLATKQYEQDILRLLENVAQWNKLEGYAAKERTIVLDITLNTFNDNEVKNVINAAYALVNSGLLNLILIQSLTKFSQLGLDKRSAGLIALINNNDEPWYVINKKFQEIGSIEEVDLSTNNYFSYFIRNHNLLLDYTEQVNESVNFVYEQILARMNWLEGLFNDRFRITLSSDSKSCYVAISMSGLAVAAETSTFEENNSDQYNLDFSINSAEIEKFSGDLLRYLIYPLCERLNLPITSRASIGFPITSVNIVMDSLRFTIGLESKEQLNYYADIISYAAFILNRQMKAWLFFDNSNPQMLYEMRCKFFTEKKEQFIAMIHENVFLTSDQDREFKYEVPYFKIHLKKGVIQEFFYRDTTVEPSNIELKARGNTKIPFTSITEKGLIISFLTKYPRSLTLDEIYRDLIHDEYRTKSTNSIGITIFTTTINNWSERRFYGFFNSIEGTKISFQLYQKMVIGLIGDKKISSENILMKQGNILIPLSRMSTYDIEQLFQQGAYNKEWVPLQDMDGPTRYLYLREGKDVPSFEMYMPTTMSQINCEFKDNRIIIEHDFVIYNDKGVTIYDRFLGEKLTCYHLDFWSEKDQVIARFLRLMTIILVKEEAQIDFVPYDHHFSFFVLNIDQNSGKILFLDSVNKIILYKQKLVELLNKVTFTTSYKDFFGELHIDESLLDQNTRIMKEKPYYFYNQFHSSTRWPVIHPAPYRVYNGKLIKESLNIINRKTIDQSIASTNDELEDIVHKGALLNGDRYLLIDPWMSYKSQAIDSILRLRLNSVFLEKNLNLVIIPSVTLKQFLKESVNIFDKAIIDQASVILLPISIPQNAVVSHWVGIVLTKRENNLIFTYIDSENQTIPTILKNELEIKLQMLFPSLTTSFNQLQSEMQRYNNCGPEVVENFIYYLTGIRATQETAIYLHSILYENLLLDSEIYSARVDENNRIIKIISNQAVPLYKISMHTKEIARSEATSSIVIFNNKVQLIQINLEFCIDQEISLSSRVLSVTNIPFLILEDDASSTINSKQSDFYGYPQRVSAFTQSFVEFLDNVASFGNKFTESFVDTVLRNNYLKYQLFNYIYHEELIQINQLIDKEYIKSNSVNGIKAIFQKHPYEWDKQDFRKIKLIVHPDKGGSAEDFRTLNAFETQIKNTGKIYENLLSELSKEFEPFIKKINLYAKEVDVVTDLVKLYMKPSIEDAISTAYDSLMLYNKFYTDSKLGYFILTATSVPVLSNLYQGEYLKAGVLAVHSYSHYLLNSNLISGYGSSVFIGLNSLTVVYDLYNGKYTAATFQAVAIASMCFVPSITGSLYAFYYTGQNLYSLIQVYHGIQQQNMVNFSNLINNLWKENASTITTRLLEMSIKQDDFNKDPAYYWNLAYKIHIEEVLSTLTIDDEFLGNEIIDNLAQTKSYIVPDSVIINSSIHYKIGPSSDINTNNIVDYLGSFFRAGNKDLDSIFKAKFVNVERGTNIIQFMSVSLTNCKIHGYMLDDNNDAMQYEYVESTNSELCGAMIYAE